MINYFTEECIKQYIRSDIEEFLTSHDVKTPLDYVLQKFSTKECTWQDVQSINSVRLPLTYFQSSCYNKKHIPFEKGEWTFLEILRNETSLLYYADDLPLNNRIIFFMNAKQAILVPIINF